MPRISLGNMIASAIAVGCLSVPQFAVAQAPGDAPELDYYFADDAVASVDDAADEAPITLAGFPVEQVVAMDAPAPCTCGGSGACCDKKKKEAVAAKVKDAYKGVYYANDFSYINDPCYTDHFPGDALKQLKVGQQGKLDLGGEIRVRYHNEENFRGFGLTGVDDQFWLTRLRLFANYRVNDWMRVYGEFLYADSGGQNFPSRTIEVNRGELQNLFVDVKLLDTGDSKLIARAGRQELLYGNQRLVSPLDWANTRRTFDGYKLAYTGADWDIDGFFVNPVNRTLATDNSFDSTDDTIDFYGAYATRKGLPIGNLDFYYLGLDYQIPNANVQTFGSRLSGNRGAWLYEIERGTQFGQNGNGTDHFAGFFTAGLGRKLDLSVGAASWKPTVWGWYDYASGEDDFAQVGRFDNGFDHLFPLGHKYLGFMDLFGRRNIQDFNAQLITPINKKVSLLVWYHYFLLNESTTPYNVTLTPFNTTTAAADRDLGSEIDVLFNINLNQRNNMLIGYSYFDSGKYYTETSNGVAGTNGIPFIGDAQFFYMQYSMTF